MGFRWGGVGSSSVVMYLPGCVRVCGGVRWGDAPRCGGVLLGLLGLCCCLKKGLSTRPGITHTQPHTHTTTHTRTHTHDHNKNRHDRRRQNQERGERQKRPQRIVGERVHERGTLKRGGEEKGEKEEK